ncbi:SUN domain-containing ossification factor-like [Artemia franciscana]|uniref:SUN domain-containing ossification factor-like n=1 Tax=Artemia franciscana TaxID=6661 RepID=UPI0032DAC7B6
MRKTNLEDSSSYSMKKNEFVLDSQPNEITVNSPTASLNFNPEGNVTQERITEEISHQNMSNESQAEGSAKDEEMPSFSEWSEKILQAEKAKIGTVKAPSAQRNGIKMRLSNYTSLSCGAKTIAANPEAENLKAILDSSYDDYMLSPCSSKSWFVVELCQTIQLQKIEIANFELFSSGFKDFRFFISDRYPTKEWVVLGSFSALDQRQEQSFDVDSEHFGKFLKVEILSHFGNEHYCPITLFRVFGTSEFEVLEKDHNEDEDFSTAEEMLEDFIDSRIPSISVTDTVINSTKIAVEKLTGKAANGETVNPGIELATPTYNCDLQSEFFEFYLKLFKNTQICKSYGFDSSVGVCCDSKSVRYTLYIAAMLGPKTMKCFCDYYLQRMTKSPFFICPSNIYSPRNEFVNISIDSIQSDTLHLIDVPDTKPFKSYEEIFEQGSEKNPKTIEKLLSETNDATIDAVNSSEKPTSEFQSMSQSKVNAESNVTVGIGSQQKETVFVRLSNKLRTLEKNITLSVEYLEKLSKDYKRKVEDLQKALNQTTGLVTTMGEQLNLLEEKYKGDFAIVKKNQEMLQKSLNTLCSLIRELCRETAESNTMCIDDLGSCEKSLSGRVSSRTSQKKRRNRSA